MSIKEWSKKNAKFIVGGVVIVALAGVLIKFGVTDKPSAETKKTNAETVEKQAKNEALGTNDLEKDKYPEINELITNYYTYKAEANIEEMKKIVPGLSEEEEKKTTEVKEIVEKYDNIACYTKLGPEDDTYIVFAYTEWKFKDIDTLVPGLDPMYVAKNEEGVFYIEKNLEDEGISSYIEGISEDQDVKDLIAEVNGKLDKAKANDEKLNEFIGKLSTSTGSGKDEGTETAKAEQEEKKEEKPQEEVPAEEQPAEETKTEEQLSEEAATKAAQGVPGRLVTLSDTVHVRAAYNENARVVYTAAPGEMIRVDMDYAEGWSKVTVWHNGKTGYIKTMYLK